MPMITSLYRYPVKGLSPEALRRVSLQAGETVPLDRVFAIAHGTTEFSAEMPQHLPKTNFLMLMKNERLAALRTVYDDSTGILHVYQNETEVAWGDLQNLEGVRKIENFFADYLREESRGMPKLVQAPGHTFSDVNAKVLSCINLATVRELEKVVEKAVDPLRFRANVYFDGVPPWVELEWVGKELRMGTARGRVLKAIERCAATEVNPSTAVRDLPIPQMLLNTYGHRHLGIYVQIIMDGEIAVHDILEGD